MLSEIKSRFFRIRASCEIIVRGHAHKDHPERKFSEAEIKLLVKTKSGCIKENTFPSAIPGSVLFVLKDDKGRACEFVILLQEVEIPQADGSLKKESIIVCSAYRKV